MAKVKDSVVEDCLRKVVRAAVAKDEEITLRQARGRVEKELGLEEGYFLNNPEWKPRSRDVLQDTINEDLPEANEPTPKAKARATQPTSGKPVAKSNPQNNASKAPSSKPTASKGPKSKLSNERVDEDDSSDEESNDSDEESSGDAVQEKPQQPEQVNGVKRKVGESSTSDEDSGSDDSSSSEDSHNAEAPQRKKARMDESSSSGEDSEDGSEGKSNKGRERSGSPENHTPTAAISIPAIPPKQFLPPTGFTSLDAEYLGAQGALSVSALEGKQIWHITAPSSLSLSSLTEISLDALRSKQPLFNRDGIEYMANEQLDSNMDAPSILLAKENGYQLLEQGIERSLHLQQQISLPNLSIRQADQNAGSSAAAQVAAFQTSRPKPQPKGLRMRYNPPGSGAGKPRILGSDSETDENTQTAENVSGNTGLTQDIGKMVVDDGKTYESAKKSKKKRKSTEDGESHQPVVNGISKPSSSTANMTTPSQSAMVNGTPEEALSKEERKRLKRERREAKQKAKEAAG